MKRPVYGRDFEGVAPRIRDARQLNRWGVCIGGYELRPNRQRGSHGDWLSAKEPLRLTEVDGNNWKTYKPLEERPDLFLKFARLARQPTSAERALNWCKEYGVLGLSGDYHWGWTGENTAPQKRESLQAFDTEVERAAGLLALYESALNRDREAAEYYALDRYPRISAELAGVRLDQEWDPSRVEEMVGLYGDGNYLTYALEAATFTVESTVREFCYPTLRAEGSNNPSNVTGGWGFKNLRGAMYLQFYWLIAAGGNVRHCKYCGGVIALSRSLPETGKLGRKPRQDRVFCDDSCRQRYHYHNRTKP